MKKIFTIGLILAFAGLFSAFYSNTENTKDDKKVKWYSWEEAVEANKTVKKKIFVDVYTDWCHWCKVMDKNTFEEEDVAAYLNEYFYPVKLNAEQRQDIQFNNTTFKWINTGRRGVHELAYSLLDGKMQYPTVVYLTEDFERIAISPGFKKPNEFMKELKFAAKEFYKTKQFNEYLKGN